MLSRFLQVLSPVLVVLCLLSYQVKHILPWNTVLDTTVCLEALLVMLLLLLLTKAPLRQALCRGDVFILLGFTAYLFLSQHWSIARPASYQKALAFLYYVVPAYCCVRLLGGAHAYAIASEHLLSRGFFTILLFAVIVSVGQFWQGRLMGSHAVDIFGANYLVTGQTIGFGFLVMLFWGVPKVATQPEELGLWQKALLTSSGIMFFSLLIPGGRGPLLMVLMTLALMGIFGLMSRCTYPALSRVGILWVLAGIALGWGLLQLLEPGQTLHTVDRLQQFYGESGAQTGDASTLERLELYQQAWHAFYQNPLLGLGVGAWPTIVSGGVVISHPHNILLEVLAELGLVGGLFMGLYAWYLLRHVYWRRVLETASGQAVLALWLFSLLNAQKSGDLIDNIFLFVWSAVLLALSPSPKSALKFRDRGLQASHERQSMTSKPHHLENPAKNPIG